MTAENYSPTASLTTYFGSRTTNRPSRHWAIEKLTHDAAAIGTLTFFEGPGPDPMALSGASTAKLWLDCDEGVTTTSGTLRYYKGTGLTTDELNWLPVTPSAYFAHLGNLSPATSAEDFATNAAVEAANISGSVSYLRTGGHTSAGDRGGALYRKVGSEPAHEAKIQSNDGAWWEIAEDEVTPFHLGVAQGVSNTTGLQNWLNVVTLWAAGPEYAPRLRMPGLWITGGRLEYVGRTQIIGDGIYSSILRLATNGNDHVLVDKAWNDDSSGTSYPVLFSDFCIDGNKANQSAPGLDGLVYMGFQSSITNMLFTNCVRHGVRATTVHRNGTEDAQSLVDTSWIGNRYVANGGAGWYGETGTVQVTLADQHFENEVLYENGSATYAQLHAMRSAGFVLHNVRTFSGNAKDDIFLDKAGRCTILGGNFDLASLGITSATADCAAIRVVPAGQTYINIVGPQVMIASEVVDNGTTRYNGIYINGSSDYVTVSGANISTNGTITHGSPMRCSGTVRGIYHAVEEGFPDASSTSQMQTLYSQFRTGGAFFGRRSVDTTNGYEEIYNSGAMAAFDSLWERRFIAKDDAANEHTYIRERQLVQDATNGSEDAQYILGISVAGTVQDHINAWGQAVSFGGATAGNTHTFPGAANAKRYYYDGGVFDGYGAGTPEGAIAAPVGSTWRRTNGGAGTSFYVKESGTGSTGWVAK